jgi:HEAT repeat protein
MIWLCPDCLAAVKARVEQEEQSERDRLAQLEREQRFARLASDRDVEGLIEALREAYVDDEFTFVTGWRGGKEGPAQSMGEALLRCGAAAVEPLIAVVEDRGGHPVGLREFAVFLLGELKDKRALAALSNVAEHEQDQRTTRPEQVETHIVAAAEAAIGKIERRWEGSRR